MVHRQGRLSAVITVLKANKYKRVPLPQIQKAAGAQHGARLKEARDLGYLIDNELERTSSGDIHSWYILRAEPGEAVPLFSNPPRDHSYDE